MTAILDAAVWWLHGYMNKPELAFLADGDLAPYRDRRWHMVETGEGRYFLALEELVVLFMFESPHGGGALGGERTLTSGETVRPNGGWSSSVAKINLLRKLDERFAALLPEPLVEASYYTGSWDTVGLAGGGWALSLARAQVDRHLPGVALFPSAGRVDTMASEEQSDVIFAGANPYNVVSEEEALRWTPWPADTPGVKPAADSELSNLSDLEVKKREARSRR